MKKLFLTSGLVLCMACPAMATTDIDVTNQNTTSATCTEPYLGDYVGPVSFEAKWTKNNYTVRYTAGTHSTGSSSDTATYDENYSIKAFGSGTGQSGIAADTGYHFVEWVGTSPANQEHPELVDATYNALPVADRTYDDNDSISPYQVAGDLTLTAQMTHNVSGAITLNSSVYTGNTGFGSATPIYTTSTTEAVTASVPTSAYAAYNIGLYDTSGHAEAGATGDNSGQITQITIPQKAGYDFKGFYDTETTPNQWIAANGTVNTNSIKTLIATQNNAETKTLYAHWDPQTYNVTYAAGTAANSSNPTVTHTPTGSTTATTVTYDAALTPTANGFTEPTGYDFDGWSGAKIDGTSGTADYAAATSYSPYKLTTGIELTAKWKPEEYTISYAKGTAGSRSADYVTGTAMADTPVKYDDPSVTLSQIGYAATGYHFVGWKSDYKFEDNSQPTGGFIYGTAGTGNADWTVPVAGTYVHPGNLTLTAQWAANKYSISFDCGTIPQGASTQTITTNSPRSAVEVTFDAAYVAMSDAPKTECDIEGYHFNGWSCTNSITSAGGTYTVDGNTVCTATWEKNEIELHWYGQNGNNNTEIPLSEDSPAANCTYDEGITLPAQPSKTGYSFNGWKVKQTVQAGD